MQTNTIKAMTLAALCTALASCAEATTVCGRGEAVQANGSSYCVYKGAIVIVGGFDCPASMQFRMDFESATVCSNHSFDNIDVPNDICARAFVPCELREDIDPFDPAACLPATDDPTYPFCAFPSVSNYGVDCFPDPPLVTAAGEVSSGGGAHGFGFGAEDAWRATHESCGPGVYCDSCVCDRPCVVGAAEGCPPAHSGNAVPICVPYVVGQYLNADGLCWLSCANGETCPDGMSCMGPVDGFDPPSESDVFRVCAWVSPKACIYGCTPVAATCNGMDNDCDGDFDENCAPLPDGGVCDVGFADCNADPADGCETSLNTLANCGGCNVACVGVSMTCSTGVCRVDTLP